MNHRLFPSALRTVADSCRVARGVQQILDRVREITKDDRSPVTVADFAVQAIVSLDLFEDDPKTLIVGEERAEVLRKPEQAAVFDAVVDAVRTVRPDTAPGEVLDAIDRCDHDASADAYWALDPVDGTKGFLRSQQYAIALGRIEGGRVTLGVIGCPNLPVDPSKTFDVPDREGAIYAAAVDEGVWEIPAADPRAEPRAIRAAAYDAGRAIRVCESVEAEHSKHSDVMRILEALGGESEPVRLDSQCKYAVVARGQADAYMRLPTRKDYVEKIWDHAAGSVIAAEAGAIVTDVTGTPLDFTHGRRLEVNRGVICAAAGLHGRIIDAIADLGIAAAAT